MVASATELWVVDLNGAAVATELSVRACAGLFNRNEAVAGGSVYTLDRDAAYDEDWLRDAAYGDDGTRTDIGAEEFLTSVCLPAIATGVIQGYVRYDFQEQQLIVPNILTIAAVLDAVPLDDNQIERIGSASDVDLPKAFDAKETLGGYSAVEATEYVFERWGQETTAMAKMNPGYDQDEIDFPEFGSLPLPRLSGLPELSLADYVVKERLFNFFLWWGCIDGTDEEALLSRMTRPGNNPWPDPIPVWGYDDSWLLGGYLFEASTPCSDHKNMGSIPSRAVNNLSWFSRREPITTPLEVVDSPDLVHDSERTYVAFVVGDGDNLEYVTSSRRAWIEERVQRCGLETSPEGCFPLLWSLSPHLLRVAPDIIRWYYNQAESTGRDSFVLPPSGHLYAYPGQLSPSTQADFVGLTESDALLMNTNGIVGWEVAGTWMDAFKSYFPRYATRNIVQAIYSLNVPYLLPILTYPFTDSYEVVDDNVVVFKPRSWRGTDERAPREFHLTTENMANEINGYDRGSVNYVYTTSDGGFQIADLFELVARLGEHVQVVDSKQLASLALQHSRRDKSWWQGAKEKAKNWFVSWWP